MLRGHVFKFQTFANEAFAHFINTFLQGNMGVTKDCSLSKTNDSVTIGAGYFCVMGRFLEIVGNETISNITNTGYYQLICEIDLTKTNTSSELNQAVIKLIRNTSAYSNLTKEDLFNGGTLYQYEFARFKVTEQGIIDFTDRRTFLNVTSLYTQINSNFNNLFEAKDQQAEALLEEIRQELANVIDGSAYLLKEGGTMSGNINMQNNNVEFSNNGGVEWKEFGYGDKFRIIADFTGADDNNKLKIQGAVGEAGTDPAFVDLGYITAKNGHLYFIGNINAPKFIGNLEGNVTGNCSGSSGSCTGNAATATKLQTARTINGTNFNGTGNITTSKWGTARNLTLSGAVSGSASVDGSGNVTISTTQANITILTTTVTTPAANESTINGVKTINYPSGYTKNNCAIISLMSGGVANAVWTTSGATGRSVDVGRYSLTASLTDSNISVSVCKIDTAEPSRNVNIKLILMKIS